MKKTRMSIDDIHAMVGSIRKNVLNMRVTNIYDVQSAGDRSGNSKTYILKLHQPPFPKVFLLLDSGVRFHTSKYARDASSSTSLPSQFTMKLRKHLRGKRLVSLTQLEGDRVVDLTFGAEHMQCHLILELYASGNIILTDENYTILSLLRTHKFDEQVKMAVKQVYPVQLLEKNADAAPPMDTPGHLMAAVDAFFTALDEKVAAGKGKKKQQTLKQVLLAKETSFGGLGPVIIEHCIVSAGLAPSLKIKASVDFRALGDATVAKLLSELQNGWTILEKLQADQQTVVGGTVSEDGTVSNSTEAADAAPKQKRGFIILKDRADESAPEQFEEFTPFLYAQHADKQVRSFDTFDEAVDEYFSRFETETAEVAKQSAQIAAENKLAKLKKNQKQQIDQLLEVQEMSLRQAHLVEANQQDVENVLLVIRSALASGMDWRGLEELVRYEQKNGNPVASLIRKMDFEKNRVSILLCDGDDDEDEEEDEGQQDKQAHEIWIDLSLSALANAREIYSKKKKAGEKVKKAADATDKAIQIAEKNTKKTVEKQHMKRNTIYQRRKILWFEKFHWFLSSENYLVIAGKDAHQNELLVKRYLRKGDVYVHADLHGAATCIVRNRAATDKIIPPVPVATLEQAGCMSVCRSNAWTSQVISSAFWVHSDQVSKTAPTGEYLSTGSFMIRGKKNYIQPSRMEMGLAIVFRVDESSIGNHQSTDFDGSDLNQEYTDQSQPENESSSINQDDKTEEIEPAEEAAEDENDAPVETETSTPTILEAEAEDVVDDAEEEEEPKAVPREGKKRLTAKERRDLKKGKILGEPEENKPKEAESRPKPKNNEPPATHGNTRGKKGKMKKMKKKYADQDEEDRRLRMEALGHAVTDENTNDSVDANDGESDDDNDAKAGEANGKPTVDDEYIRQQREKKEKYLDEQEEEAEGADFFDAFTGSPSPHDLVLFAMPMCAPYSSLNKYIYKVKLTPGSQKKGKAAKQAMEYFIASNLKAEKDNAARIAAQAEQGIVKPNDEPVPDVDPVFLQRELLKCIPENELVNCMVGPVKISGVGLYGSTSGAKKGGAGNRGSKKPSKGKKK